MHIIKKYRNRIMYDSKTSKPVTLAQIAGMMKNNTRVRILEDVSGRDITVLTILQILVEIEKSGKGIRCLIPELIAWGLNTSKNELRRMIKEMFFDAFTGHEGKYEPLKSFVNTGTVSSKKTLQLQNEITSRLNEFYNDLLLAIENLLYEKFGSMKTLL